MKIKPDKSLYLSIIFFIFISLYLGTLNNFYRYEWWDTMLHVVSGIIIGFFAIIILKKHNPHNSMNSYNPVFVFIFVLSLQPYVVLYGKSMNLPLTLYLT